jgi:hypothetical protein
LNEELRYRIETVENDIDIRIESAIDDLHKLRDDLKNELKEIKEKFQVSLLMKNLAENRLHLEEIKRYFLIKLFFLIRIILFDFQEPASIIMKNFWRNRKFYKNLFLI